VLEWFHERTEKSEMIIKFDKFSLTDTTNVLDIKVPPQLDLVRKTGFCVWDDAFSGIETPDDEKGMVPSTVCLFTGDPGSGKSTMARQLADSLTAQGHVALYNSGEESAFQVRKACRRLEPKHGFILSDHRMVDDLIDHGKRLQAQFRSKQLFVIVDSLATLDDGKYGDGHTNGMTAVRVIERLCEFAKSTYAIVIVIGHVNKDGKWAGKNTLKHAIDSHCHLCFDADPNSPTFGHRLFEVQKNRWGVSGISYMLKMTVKGLKEAA